MERPAPMLVEAWSDVVCPWCAIGKAHLEAALDRFPHADSVEVVRRSYELHPGAPAERPGRYSDLLARAYGSTAAGGAAMAARISHAAELAGLQVRFDLIRTGSSFDAHRLLHLARGSGRQGALMGRLTTAYLGEGALLSDPDVLVALAVESGLDEDEARQVLDTDAYAEAVREDEAEASRREITAVPTFVVDGGAVIPGAQSPESMLGTLRRVWNRRST